MKIFSSIQRATDLQNSSPACRKGILGLRLWLVGYAVLLAFSSVARANDSVISGWSGTPRLLKGEHRSIAMQSEKVVIVANDKTYDTTVDFIFRNDGPATSVQMGFPDGYFASVELAHKSGFSRFATWVDGQRVPARRIITHNSEPNGGLKFAAYWIKTVRFGPRQTRRIRVSYVAPMAEVGGTQRDMNYDFTGKNWQGKVRRSDLEIHIRQPGLWTGSSLWNDAPLAMNLGVGPNEAVFRKTWRNWQAQGYFSFRMERVVPNWMTDRNRFLYDTKGHDQKEFAAARTFRVGAAPQDLPQDVNNPLAFTRNDVTYIHLRYLKLRLRDFAEDLRKYRNVKVKPVSLDWNAQTGVSTLVAGSKTLKFQPGKSQSSDAAPILLRGSEFRPTLYVPLAPLAKTLGLSFKLDPKNHLFDLSRGTWTGQ